MDTATQVTCTTASALPRRRSSPATQTVNNHDRYYDFLLPIFQMIPSQRLPAVLALMQRLESISINKYTQSVKNVGGKPEHPGAAGHFFAGFIGADACGGGGRRQ